MPNLRVLHAQDNDFCKKIPSYRKTLIFKLKTLTYLDDRPVSLDDRRRAEAFARGGIDEEREELRKIRKEADEKHWENHEKMMEMVGLAKEAAVKKVENKLTMKEMMAKAKAEKSKKEEMKNKAPTLKFIQDVMKGAQDLDAKLESEHQ